MTKRKGAIIPDPIDTPGTRKVVVCIPDTVEWLSLFTGLVSQLRYGWYWDRSTGDLDAIRDRAKRVYFEMQEQDGDCMDLDCDQVAECIENSEAVQKAIQRLMFGGTAPGDKMSATKRNADLGSGYNPECNLDILWSQCKAIVERMNGFLVSFCNLIETQSNSIEIGTAIASLPGLENLGISSLTGLADTLFAALPENYATDYAAADPVSGIFWWEQLACDIFCACQDDCELTVERIWQVLQLRLEAQIAGLADDWADLLAWILDFANLDITLVNMADFFFYLAFSGLRLGGSLLVSPATGDKVLQVAVALAADEPSNDWESLCECADVWVFDHDLTVDDGGFVANTVGGFNASWGSGDGWYRDSVANNPALRIWKAWEVGAVGTITRIELTVQAPAIGSTTHQVGWQDMDEDGSPLANIVVDNDLLVGETEFSNLVSYTPVNDGFGIFLNNFIVANGARYKFTHIRVVGTGDALLV